MATGTARYEPRKSLRRLNILGELSLSGSWSGAHGSHLTFVASEDFRQTATVVPSLPPVRRLAPQPKDRRQGRLRGARSTRARRSSATLERRRARAARAAARRASHLAFRRRDGRRRLFARWAARSARCWRWRKPARSARSSPSRLSPIPAKPFRFLAGDPLEPGPFGILQPSRRAPPVEPDLILVPLIAIDGRGTRLGRGKGHYDRVLARLAQEARG